MYAYVGNAPVNSTDPTGQVSWGSPSAVIGLAILNAALDPEVANAPGPGDKTYPSRGPVPTILTAVGMGVTSCAGEAISPFIGKLAGAVLGRGAAETAGSDFAEGAYTTRLFERIRPQEKSCITKHAFLKLIRKILILGNSISGSTVRVQLTSTRLRKNTSQRHTCMIRLYPEEYALRCLGSCRMVTKMKESSNSLLVWLQDWLKRNVDGDWEHRFGVKIESIDNPGWAIRIDLSGTAFSSKQFSPIQLDTSETDWMTCRVSNERFEAFCDPSKLGKS